MLPGSLFNHSIVTSILAATYQIRRTDLIDDILLVGLGVDGTVVLDGIDLLTVVADFGHCVALVLLQLLDDAVHDIDEDDLRSDVD